MVPSTSLFLCTVSLIIGELFVSPEKGEKEGVLTRVLFFSLCYQLSNAFMR